MRQSKPKIKPFHFSLKRIDAEAQGQMELLLSAFDKERQQQLEHAIAAVLHEHTGLTAQIQLEGLEHNSVGEFLDRLPNRMLDVVLSVDPSGISIHLDVDVYTAQFLIDRLLGAKEETPLVEPTFSDIDQGVLQYLVLNILQRAHETANSGESERWRFVRFALSPEEAAVGAHAKDAAIVLTWRMQLGQHTGFVRACLPRMLLSHIALAPSKAMSTQDLAEKLMQECADMRVSLWAEAGRTQLDVEELAQLEVGDVMLFDDAPLRLHDPSLSGEIILRAGLGQEAGIVAEIHPVGRLLRCRLKETYRGASS